jgi:CIC family chloride channel protein
MAGPSQSEKLQYSAADRSFSMQEGFARLFRNIILVMLLGVLSWGICTSLKLAIVHTSEYIFGQFNTAEVGHHRQVHDYALIDTHTAETTEIAEPTADSAHAVTSLLIIILFGGLVRGILIRNKSWYHSEGDGATQTIQYFLESYALGEAPGVVAEHRYKKSTLVHAAKRYIMTFLTLGCGGSGGLEGPVIPIGECMGAWLAKTFHIRETDDLRAFQMAGIAAAVCTLLNAPFASAIFAAEVVYSERIVYRTLLYSIFSVLVAFKLNTFFMGQGKLFVVPYHAPSYDMIEYLYVVLVAVFCSGPVGVGLSRTFAFFKGHFTYVPVMLRSPLGALCTAGIALSLWFWLGIEPQHVLGMGEETIEDLLYGTGNPQLQVWWVLALVIIAKTLATGFTLMTGGSAGLLIPAMVLGGCMGAVLHGLMVTYIAGFHTGIALFVISGIGSALVSIIETPISAILLIISIFGDTYAAPAMLSVAICHLLVKNLKLYMR